MIKTSDFNYPLPAALVANHPVSPRDHCRLMLLDRQTGKINHQHFYDLVNLLNSNDVLVLNQSKVFPARLFGQKTSGGQVEILLLRQINSHRWRAISSPRPKVGTIVNFKNNLSGKIVSSFPNTGEIEINFNQTSTQFFTTLNQTGQTPVPPYIHSSQTESQLRQDYQTVYAKDTGSAAAPTAGLHFTEEMLTELRNRGVQVEYLTLHVGLGTFQPLRPNNLTTHTLHSENYVIDPNTAARLRQAKASGKRIIAVGTTTLRALESWILNPSAAATDIFIYPPYQFNFVDSLVTNFHLPESSLLMLVTAFTSQPNTPHIYRNFQNTIIYKAYQSAIKTQYRFFSFGDAVWIY